MNAYTNFYLSILIGTVLLSGMFYSQEFGFFTPKFLLSGCYTLFPAAIIYFALRQDSKHQLNEGIENNGVC